MAPDEATAPGDQHSLGHVVRSFLRFGRAVDELVEAALVARNFFLIEEGELSFFEDTEEFLPGDPLQVFIGFLEIDPQYAALSLRFNDGWASASLIGPFADLVVVGGGCCL